MSERHRERDIDYERRNRSGRREDRGEGSSRPRRSEDDRYAESRPRDRTRQEDRYDRRGDSFERGYDRDRRYRRDDIPSPRRRGDDSRRFDERQRSPPRHQKADRYESPSGERPRSGYSPPRARQSSSPTRRPARRDERAEAEEEAEDTPDFGSSGLLAKESNQVNGTALKYHEPPEAKQPKKKWRLYVFKDGQEVDLFHVSRQSCYLFGRDRQVVDILTDHASCSKQHAVIQYRLNITRNEFGDEKRNVKPYLLDLDSANGTTVNQRKVPPSRYYELKNGDTVRFAASEREYVLLCEDV